MTKHAIFVFAMGNDMPLHPFFAKFVTYNIEMHTEFSLDIEHNNSLN